MRSYKTVWAQHLNDEVKRRFYKNYYKSKKAAFRKYAAGFDESKLKSELEDIKKHCSVVRAIAHTQARPAPRPARRRPAPPLLCRLTVPSLFLVSQNKKAGCNNTKGQRKAHIMEIQVNGGNVAAKVDFAYSLFEKAVSVDTVFAKDEMIDTIAITKGKGTEGVVARWGVSRLPRKTHRGLRKVGCIGAWHPAAVKWTVPRAGQMGFHHRTEINKKVYKLGKAGEASHKATTDFDMTEKVRGGAGRGACRWRRGPDVAGEGAGHHRTVSFPRGARFHGPRDVTRCKTDSRSWLTAAGAHVPGCGCWGRAHARPHAAPRRALCPLPAPTPTLGFGACRTSRRWAASPSTVS